MNQPPPVTRRLIQVLLSLSRRLKDSCSLAALMSLSSTLRSTSRPEPLVAWKGTCVAPPRLFLLVTMSPSVWWENWSEKPGFSRACEALMSSAFSWLWLDRASSSEQITTKQAGTAPRPSSKRHLESSDISQYVNINARIQGVYIQCKAETNVRSLQVVGSLTHVS